MPLLIEDEKVDALAGRYQAMIHADSKQEAVRHALEKVLTDPSLNTGYVEKVVALTRDFNLRTRENSNNLDDRAFMEGLFGEN